MYINNMLHIRTYVAYFNINFAAAHEYLRSTSG